MRTLSLLLSICFSICLIGTSLTSCRQDSAPESKSDKANKAVEALAEASGKKISSLAPSSTSNLNEGDVLLIQAPGGLMNAVTEATGSPWTHCGVVLRNSEGELQIAEAVGPVQWTPIRHFVERAHEHQVRIFRPIFRLTEEKIQQLRASALEMMGLPYDPQFLWSDISIYCSEFVWKVFHNALGVELVNLSRFSDFKLDGPAVRAIMPRLHPQGLPLDEPTVPPHRLAESRLLKEIFLELRY